MPTTLQADPTKFNTPITVPEDGDDAYAETLSDPAQALLDKSAYLYQGMKSINATIAALFVLPSYPDLEATPENPTELRHLRVETSNLEEGRVVKVHLAAFLIDIDKKPVYVNQYSRFFEVVKDQIVNLDDLPANLYWCINFDPGVGYVGRNTYYFIGTKHTLFNMGRLPNNTAATPYIVTHNVERLVVQKPVEIVMDRVAGDQLLLVTIYRDMNVEVPVKVGNVIITRTSTSGLTTIPLGNFDGGVYRVDIEGSTAMLSPSGFLTVNFVVGGDIADNTKLTIGVNGTR